jgi:hypothetical protein
MTAEGLFFWFLGNRLTLVERVGLNALEKRLGDKPRHPGRSL